MEHYQYSLVCQVYRFSVKEDGCEVGRACLIIVQNDVNKQPIGLMDDVFVAEEMHGRGVRVKLVNQVMAKARDCGCSKVISTGAAKKVNL